MGTREDLITPPQPPPVRRLNRGVWIAAMVLVGGTLLAIVFLAAPRGAGRRAGAPSPAPPLAGSDPGFLSRPPGELPAAAPSVSEQEYLRGLLARQGRTGGVGEGAGGPGVGGGEGARGMVGAGLGAGEGGGMGAGGVGAGAGAASRGGVAAAGSGGPRDPRREAFLRALQAPLARSTAPAGRAAGRSGLNGAWDGGGGGGGEPGWTGGEEGGGGEVPPPPGLAGGGVKERGVALPGPGWPGGAGAPFAGVPAAAAQGRGWAAQGGLAGGAEEPAAGDGGSGSGSGAAGKKSPGATLAGGEGRFAAFSGAAGRLRGRTDLPVRYHPAPGPTTLPAGSLIPALLLTEVNSDLPGNLLAQVSRNVYDGRQERVLVPQGSRLLGRYDSQVAVGQRRLLVAWTRLVLPDGSSYELPGLPGTTAAGAAGLGGRVNNHVLQVFGDALLLSLLSAGAELSQPRQGSFTAVPSTGAVAAAALGQELSSVGLQLLARGMAIQPTLRLPAATRFLVFVNGDLDLGRGAGEGLEQR
ncbi:MAG TPA: TrbI/VirB10 family protein [Thermoanaerobaculia bacterium]|nr:TrbI/VirB10 family protein [Thermoanaerobaculia bacterium]